MTPSTVAAPDTNPLRQLAALFRMELLLLLRNRAATLLVAVLPLPIAYLRLRGYDVAAVGAPAAVARLAGLFGVLAVLFIHHHLVTVYATRRQELVLKRLRAGLPSERIILTGAASATVALLLGQVLLIAAYGILVLGIPVPANPVPVLLALGLFAALMVTVSAAMSSVTRSSEAAMVTTFPTMALFLATPGLLVPFGTLPAPVEQLARFGPVGPYAELVRNGWLGQDRAGADLSLAAGLLDALPGLAVMAGWVLLTWLLVRRWFRWEPRHG